METKDLFAQRFKELRTANNISLTFVGVNTFVKNYKVISQIYIFVCIFIEKVR